MRLYIDPKEGKPIYRQIIDQIKYLIAAGRLQPGDELPTIRGLAEELLINPNTVARAYREMEQAGILATRHGAGTFVSKTASPMAYEERRRILKERVRLLLSESYHLGFELDEIQNLVREIYEEEHIQTRE